MEKIDLNKIKDYRYERKIVINSLDNKEIERIIKFHPTILFERYPQRFVNNIYFDTTDFINYYDNIDGVADRCKVRIRWYGNLFGLIKNPKLELKIKKGLLGEKQIFSFPEFKLNKKFNINTLQHIIRQSSLPLIIKNNITLMFPTLLNRYKRKYYESFNKKYRLTIDSDMEYHQIKRFNNSFANFQKDYKNIVLEFKYSQYNDSNADYFSNYFPFRITKNSKYINGTELMTI